MKAFVTILIIFCLAAVAGYFFTGGAGDTSDPAPDSNETPENDETPMPVEGTEVYSGTLPSGTGEGIDTELILTDRGDGMGGSFTLTQVYIGETGDPVVYEGQWETKTGVIDAAPEAEVIVLTSEDFEIPENPRYYEIVNENTIRALSLDASRIESDLPYELELES